MSKERCCGNCKHFDGVVDAVAWCPLIKDYQSSDDECVWHHQRRNSWTEITPDNVDELYNINEDLLMIASKLLDKIYYQYKPLMPATLNTLAKLEGYYYYVLPELKLDGTE